MDFLGSGEWVCGAEMLRDGFAYYSQRASEVNARTPGRIRVRKCQRHHHNVYEYLDTVAAQPKQLALAV